MDHVRTLWHSALFQILGFPFHYGIGRDRIIWGKSNTDWFAPYLLPIAFAPMIVMITVGPAGHFNRYNDLCLSCSDAGDWY